MNRRQFVALLLAAVTGCLGRPGTGESESATPTQTPTSAQTPTPAQTPTSAQTPTPAQTTRQTSEESLSADLEVVNFHDDPVTVAVRVTRLSGNNTDELVFDLETTVSPDESVSRSDALRCSDPCSFRIAYDIDGGTDGHETVELRDPGRTAFSVQINSPTDVQVFPIAR